MLKPVVVLKYTPDNDWRLTADIEYMAEHKDILKASMDKEYIFKEGQQLYCLPDVSIPRFKLKIIGEKLGISFIRSSEKADYIFINGLPKNKSAAYLSNQEVQYKNYRCIVKGSTNDNSYALFTKFRDYFKLRGDRRYEEFMEKLQEYDRHSSMEIVISEADVEKFLKDYKETTSNYLWYGYGYNSKNYLSLKNPSLLSKIRHQDDLLPYINGDSMIITDEKMNELQAMFDSTDTSNHILAIEMMANSNYEESILNNYILLTKNLKKIAQLRESGHRNFQGFLQFYELDIRYIQSNIKNSDVDKIAELLKEYGKLTEESMEKILYYYADTHNQYEGKFCNSRLVPNSNIEYDNGAY